MTATAPRVSDAARKALVATAAAGASAAVGAASVTSPSLAAVAAVGLLGAVVAARAPVLVFTAALGLLAYAPETLHAGGVLAHPELQKGLPYLALVPVMLVRGVRLRLLLPIFAYVALAVLSYLDGQLNPALGLSQMGSSFVTLTLCWAALSVRWDWRRDLPVLKAVTFLPIVCVALGLVLHALGQSEWLQPPDAENPVSRLRGASLAAVLGMNAFVCCAIALLCRRAAGWRPGSWVALANAAILFATVSRGAAIALAIALVAPAVRYVLAPLARRPDVTVRRLVGVSVILIAVAALAVPALESRNAPRRNSAGQRTDTTSGRSEAWAETYAIAKQAPLFGHGLGSGPVTKIKQRGFLAQHNEYLRLFLEGGYVGGGLVLISIIAAVTTAIRRAPPGFRAELTGIAVGIAFLSITDNTLTSIMLSVPFGLVLAFMVSAGE